MGCSIIYRSEKYKYDLRYDVEKLCGKQIGKEEPIEQQCIECLMKELDLLKDKCSHKNESEYDVAMGISKRIVELLQKQYNDGLVNLRTKIDTIKRRYMKKKQNNIIDQDFKDDFDSGDD